MRLCFAWLFVGCLLVGCATPDSRHDWWGIRITQDNGREWLHSISHVNAAKPPRTVAVDARPLREQRRGRLSIAVHYDAPLAADWTQAGPYLAREMDKALDWLRRLAGPSRQGVRVMVTLVDERRHLHMVHDHDLRNGPVIDLYVPVAADPASRSALVGKALAIALHEAAHALPADSATGKHARYRDEFRASLVAACYLIDTLRPGDTLRLAAAPTPGNHRHYASHESRRAADDVTRLLRATAGSDSVAANDRATRHKLDAVCATAVP